MIAQDAIYHDAADACYEPAAIPAAKLAQERMLEAKANVPPAETCGGRPQASPEGCVYLGRIAINSAAFRMGIVAISSATSCIFRRRFL